MNKGETESCELTSSSNDNDSYTDSLNNEVTERKRSPLVTEKVDNKLFSRNNFTNINPVRPTSPLRIKLFQKSAVVNKVQPKQGHNFAQKGSC
jgi:hypothetical protein